ncbi:MAG: hypothetical protein AAF721_42405 [Myxococcota bacterium]
MTLLTRARLPIADPCQQDFGRMPRTGSRMYCDRCEKSVHDLTTMTEAEAGAFLAKHSGARVCVRYAVDEEGALRFRPAAPIAKGGALLALASMAAACAGHAPEAGGLTVPEAPVCEDVAGYSIPCEDSEDNEDNVAESTRTRADVERGETPASEPDSQPIAFEELEPYEAPTEPSAWGEPANEGETPPQCPLPDPERVEVLMGDIAPEYSRAERRRLIHEDERATRRERRRRARRERRLAGK